MIELNFLFTQHRKMNHTNLIIVANFLVQYFSPATCFRSIYLSCAQIQLTHVRALKRNSCSKLAVATLIQCVCCGGAIYWYGFWASNFISGLSKHYRSVFFVRDLVIIPLYFPTNSFCGLTSLPFGSMLSGFPCFDGCTSRFS
jgi:hypothetical protein